MLQERLARLVRGVLRNRLGVAAFVALVSVAALAVLPRMTIASSLQSMFFGPEHPGYTSYQARIAQFGSDEVFLFGVEVDEPLGVETLEKLERFHELAAANPEVRRVQSIANLERVGLVGETIGVRRFAELVASDPASGPSLLEEIRADPIAGDLFVSRAHSDVLVLVENRPDPSRAAEAGPGQVAALRAQLEEAGFAAGDIHAGGLMAVLAAMMQLSRDTLTVMFPLVTLSLLLAVFLMFGRMWPVVVTTVSALIAVLWTTAASVWVEPVVNILMSILPTFVMIISFSDVVHMCSAYLLNLEAGEAKEDAITKATSEVGAACFLTSITTAVGFVALVFVPSPSFVNLGWAAAIGVIVAYVLALVTVPVLLSFLPTPGAWHRGRAGGMQRALDTLLRWLSDLTTRRPWPVIGAFAVLSAVLVAGSLQLNFETEFDKRLDPDHPVRRDADYLAERFVEMSIVDVYVDTPRAGALLEAETFARLVALEAELESWPEVDKVVSFVDLMRATHRSIVGADVPFGPFEADALAQMMVLLEMPGPDALSAFVDFERRSARLTVYTKIDGIVGQYELRERIEAAAGSLGDGVVIEATGVGPLMGAWLDDILAGQRRGLLFSLFVIMVLLALGFRSLRVGVVSMVPNVLPLFAAGAWCGFFWEQTDSDTLIVGMIALGIGVDDTIHFVSRYKTELERRERLDAIRETFRYAGRGIFITTFVFVLGFLPAMTSDYSSIWAMGLLLPVCFIVALLADLLLVPALCAVGLIE